MTSNAWYYMVAQPGCQELPLGTPTAADGVRTLKLLYAMFSAVTNKNQEVTVAQ